MAAPSLTFKNGSGIPVVGLGTWQCTDKKELEAALNAALESGYRHIDTAFAYRNEDVIGNVINQWFSEGKLKREDLFITTKLPLEAIAPDKVEEFLKKSLKSLQLTYVDLYLIHFPVGIKAQDNPSLHLETIPTDHLAVWKKMEEQVDAGLTKAIGVSNFNIKQVERILKNSRIQPACLQIENHVFLQQTELVKYCQDNGIVVVAYSPLGSPGIGAFHARFGSEPKNVPKILEDPTMKRIADKHKKTPAHVALKFLLQRNIVVIPKSVTESRVKQNIKLFDFTLDDDDIKSLKALDVGEDARVCDFSFSKSLSAHPEWPFPK
ncbi:aldo-keto reductase family 1 member B1-like [Euwallacea similis]|uniref:aldo-keto reductase family 1 member B1-like n=1 Tax=Euwallacea similis TaxID=1736056 RepID=UPI00344B835D